MDSIIEYIKEWQQGTKCIQKKCYANDALIVSVNEERLLDIPHPE